uniref:RRM domain-containing protein n=1 Tax=Timema poppense TaxID=170557 RepID=A0A7R9DJS0_TIMPO|nr:unnamed protein product [Timema poppensis]
MLGADGDRRRSGVNMTQQYSDNQQLFLGNLPHAATEDDLKQLFSKFGAVIDLRIHSKTNNKGMNGNRVPNYGFITFEEPSTVQAVLSSRVSQELPHRCTVQAFLSSQVSQELPHRCTDPGSSQQSGESVTTTQMYSRGSSQQSGKSGTTTQMYSSSSSQQSGKSGTTAQMYSSGSSQQSG